MAIKKEELYKLPYSKFNNPNGWLEPTTFCQLKCPGCYRGADSDSFKASHKSLDEQKREIDSLIEKRNIQTVSIAGGDPLLYPFLDELIEYANFRKLNTIVITNGVLLNRERLEKLKRSGATLIMIHIDKYQKREGIQTEDDANKLRKKYCDLFREVGGISLGFIMPISKDNLDDLEVLLTFFRNNHDIINTIIFTILEKRLALNNSLEIDSDRMNIETVAERIKQILNIEYCAWLGKAKSDGFSWLVAYSFYKGEKFLGSVDGEVVEFFEKENYKREKRYSYGTTSFRMSFKEIVFALSNNSLRKMLIPFFLTRGKLYEQRITINNMPEYKNNEWFLCESCPNAMLYKDELVPSCLIERIMAGETIKLN